MSEPLFPRRLPLDSESLRRLGKAQVVLSIAVSVLALLMPLLFWPVVFSIILAAKLRTTQNRSLVWGNALFALTWPGWPLLALQTLPNRGGFYDGGIFFLAGDIRSASILSLLPALYVFVASMKILFAARTTQ